MPPKAKFKKEEIVEAALGIVRIAGMSALTARSLGAALGASSCPIFTVFSGMEEVTAAVLEAANGVYLRYLREDMESTAYPPYKASGMAYIRFAKEEPELFKLLFMRDRTGEVPPDGREELRPLLALLQKNLGLDEDTAYLFHLEMWIYVHGIATMLATGYLTWEPEFVSAALTDMYQGLKYRFTEGAN